MRLEAELKSARGRRRRRMLVNLVVATLVVGTLAFFLTSRTSERKKRLTKTCQVTEDEASTASALAPRKVTIDTAKRYLATIETSEGSIEIDLADDDSPCTVNSFVALARRGFYNGLSFHRVVPGFAIQGGDPKGDGSGGPGYKVIEAPKPLSKYPKGTVAMAKAGADPAGSSGSQFFIVPGNGGAQLNGSTQSPALYAILGKVITGFDTLAKIEAVGQGPSDSGEQSKPLRPITIIKVTIAESTKSS